MIDEEGVRRARLQLLRDRGENPYPSRADRTHTVSAFLAAHDALLKGPPFPPPKADPPLAERGDAGGLPRSGEKAVVRLIGRVRTLRRHGGLTFVHVQDETGKVQLVIHKDQIGENTYAALHETWDIGDWVEVNGCAFTTKKGERSLDVASYRLITKSLLPLPEKWHGLTDVETRFRERELDLIMNEGAREVFEKRSKMVSRLRDLLEEVGYMEVETPILQPIPGGANARPFVTHHHALGIDLYMRVAPELYLKRLIVGGFSRVYEIGRSFRNEGIDHQHNPEFTSVEAYAAYGDYSDIMDLIEHIMPELALRVCGSLQVPFGDAVIDFTAPYPRLTFFDAIKKHTKEDLRYERDRKKLSAIAKKLGGGVSEKDSVFSILDEIFKKSARQKIVHPTFITDYPVELSPLAKRKATEPDLVERAVLVIAGAEVMNGFSELNDPLDQEERFREQEEAHAQGDVEAQRMDTAFIEALKHGMPPTFGWAIGIDRLAMILTNRDNIKEVILFPTLRPR